MKLCKSVAVIYEKEPRCAFLQSPVYVFGDIHGNLEVRISGLEAASVLTPQEASEHARCGLNGLACARLTSMKRRQSQTSYITTPSRMHCGCYFMYQPTLCNASQDLHFFADNIWKLGMNLTAGKFLFLGDYVDRGLLGLECLAYLFSLKVRVTLFRDRCTHVCCFGVLSTG